MKMWWLIGWSGGSLVWRCGLIVLEIWWLIGWVYGGSLVGRCGGSLEDVVVHWFGDVVSLDGDVVAHWFVDVVAHWMGSCSSLVCRCGGSLDVIL